MVLNKCMVIVIIMTIIYFSKVMIVSDRNDNYDIQMSNDSTLVVHFPRVPVSVLHHPVHELLSRPSSSSLSLHLSLHYLIDSDLYCKLQVFLNKQCSI